jgi:hypothetical protein
MSDTVTDPVPAAKPGYKTTEFWLKLAAILLTALFASGVIPTSGPVATVTAIAATMLGALGYTVARTFAKSAGAAVIVILLGAGAASSLPACGGTQSSRSATIVSLESSIQSASAALRTYEHERAEVIIATAHDAATAQAARVSLTAFRAKVDKVWLAVDAARLAIDSANTLNDDPSLKGAQTALTRAITAITELTGGTP